MAAKQAVWMAAKQAFCWSKRSSAVALVMAAFLIAGGSSLVGCRSAAKPGETAKAKGYPIRGVVVGTEAAGGQVVLKGDAVPGVMDAMTMSYGVEDPAALAEMHPGDAISATLVFDEDAAGLKNLRLKDVVILAQGKADYVPSVQYHVPSPGDSVPDFVLLDQSGKTVGLKSLRGKVVVMTFIYTRCPLADYCIRMSRNFADIDKALQADKALYAKTHLLSVSFDPAFDTPKVLKQYGEGCSGRSGKDAFAHWEFAAPSVAELPSVEQYFDVGVTTANTGALQHSLSTVVIGKDGKVVGFWPTNDWTVDEVLAKVKAAAG
jgi:protein SCO1/2